MKKEKMKPSSGDKANSGSVRHSDIFDSHQLGLKNKTDAVAVILSIVIILFVIGVIFYVVQHVIELFWEYKNGDLTFPTLRRLP